MSRRRYFEDADVGREKDKDIVYYGFSGGCKEF
jgi:hypothetical protein